MKTLRKISLFFLFFSLILSSACTQNASKTTSEYPAWVKDAVFYQIFPERFRNGDPANDPQIPDLHGAWPHVEITEWSVSPWTSDWYKLQPWEEKNNKGFYYNAQLRRYGGDLQGVIDKLDYLADLGINAIYFNPVFEAPSLHKYDAAMFHHIDDNFGPDPKKDRTIMAQEDFADPETWQWTTADKLFLELLQKAHDRNIRIIIDGVFNHVGLRFWAFEDVRKNGQNSKYKDWFIIKSWDDPKTPEDEFDYAGWMGVKDLPEFREDENSIVTGPREHIFAIVKRWMDPNGDGDPSDGIDGWRLDVVEMVAHEFWRDFRKVVKGINPQAYITAELFWDDWQNNLLMDPTPWLQGDQFDGVMNYRWSAAVTNYFIDKKTRISASQFSARLTELWHGIPEPTNYILQNLMDSHDTDRLASNIINPDCFYDKKISPKDKRDYDVRKPTQKEREIQKLITLFQMTFAGAPMIYYGTESGMWGADDPDERKPMVWPDMTYETETTHPFGDKRPDDSVEFDQDLFDFYKKLIGIRNKYPVFRHGSWKMILTDDEKDVLAMERRYKDDFAIVVINNSENTQQVNISVTTAGNEVTDILNDKNYKIEGNKLHLNLNGKSGGIFLPKN
jgi:glycosidase